MKKKFTLTKQLIILSICVAMFTACKKEMNTISSGENISLSKATVFTSNEKQPLDEIVFVPCANNGTGENVHLTGTIHILIHTVLNKNNFTTKYHFQPQGISGTGEITGDKYHGSGVTQEEVKGSLKNGKYIDTYINNFKIVRHGTNYKIHVNTHITVNATGETTATVDNFTSDCK